jgi:hypothetical protein
MDTLLHHMRRLHPRVGRSHRGRPAAHVHWMGDHQCGGLRRDTTPHTPLTQGHFVPEFSPQLTLTVTSFGKC